MAATRVEQHTDNKGGAGWTFWDAERGSWMVEHCVNGYWGCCPIGGTEDRPVRATSLAAMNHLAVKRHQRHWEPAQLCGTHHAGNGHKGPHR